MGNNQVNKANPRSLSERNLLKGNKEDIINSKFEMLKNNITDVSIKITTGISAVVPTQDFQNIKPYFGIEKTFNVINDNNMQSILKHEIDLLEAIVYSKYTNFEKREVMKQIAQRIKGLRFYPKGIERYISVTSILGALPEDKINIGAIELQQYASQGSISHLRLEYLAKTGHLIIEEKELAELIPESHFHLDVLRMGALRLPPITGKFKEYLTKYPIQILSDNFIDGLDMNVKTKKENIKIDIKPFMETERVIFNDKYKYAGTLDLIGYPHPSFKGADHNKLTIFDLKRSLNKDKNLMQTAAYAKAYEEETGRKIEQMIILVLNDKTEQGYSKPCISLEVDKYFGMFLDKKKLVEKYLQNFGYAISL